MIEQKNLTVTLETAIPMFLAGTIPEATELSAPSEVAMIVIKRLVRQRETL